MTGRGREERLSLPVVSESGDVFCTAGVSYFVVRGDGKVYRCLYNPRLVGTLEGFDRLSYPEMRCSHKLSHTRLDDTCHPSGDLMFATWWEDGPAKRIHRAPWSGKKWREGSVPEEAERKSAVFVCLPVDSKCNFRCPYCCNYYSELSDGTVVGRPKDHWSDLPLSAWDGLLSFVEGLSYAHVGFLGGEPTLYAHLAGLSSELVSRGVEVGVCSNMSLPKTVREVASRCRRSGSSLLSFSASLHPSSPGFRWKTFLESVEAALEHGARVRATMVGWPEQMRLYSHCAARLEKVGVSLWLKPIGGYDLSEADLAFVRSKGPQSTPEALDAIDWVAWSEQSGERVGEGRSLL